MLLAPVSLLPAAVVVTLLMADVPSAQAQPEPRPSLGGQGSSSGGLLGGPPSDASEANPMAGTPHDVQRSVWGQAADRLRRAPGGFKTPHAAPNVEGAMPPTSAYCPFP